MAGVPRPVRQTAKHPTLRRLGTRVCELRQEGNMSQEALAYAAGISRSYMSGIERGVRNCSALHLIKIARALRVPVGDLFPQ